ncbi:MAG: cupredoxin domain-containing protein [Mycobacteriales bacterium]|nr:cupredoxin domain-containing protein [Frankia sp.]
MSVRPLACAVAALALTGCSGGGGATVDVTSTEDACRVSTTQLESGKTTLRIRNDGTRVTEVYVYRNGTEVVTEKENIGPGTTAKMSVTLATGAYDIACKPGMEGDGIRTAITVR